MLRLTWDMCALNQQRNKAVYYTNHNAYLTHGYARAGAAVQQAATHTNTQTPHTQTHRHADAHTDTDIGVTKIKAMLEDSTSEHWQHRAANVV